MQKVEYREKFSKKDYEAENDDKNRGGESDGYSDESDCAEPSPATTKKSRSLMAEAEDAGLCCDLPDVGQVVHHREWSCRVIVTPVRPVFVSIKYVGVFDGWTKKVPLS